MRRLLTLAFAITLLTSPSSAWHELGWKKNLQIMLLDEKLKVRKATAEETKNYSLEGYGQALAVTEYRTPDFPTTVYFHFLRDRLSAIYLVIKDLKDARTARSRLLDQYGPPLREREDVTSSCTTITLRWRDAESSSNISFRSWSCPDNPKAGSYTILYTPFLTHADTGL